MLSKRILILGLFLAAGFLFLNISAVKAETWTWTGGGDTHTWTDPANWGLDAAHSSLTQYPGATTTADVVIAANARVIATTTISTTGGLGSLTLGAAATGVSLTIAGNATIYASSTISLLSTSTLVFGDSTSNINLGGQAALGLGAGNLYLGLYNVATTSLPLSVGQLATFLAGTSTVTYAGVGKAHIATTTYYNLSLTPTSTIAAVYTFGGPKGGANVTVSNVLTIGQYAQLNMNGGTLTLLASSTPLVYQSDGSFVANNSTVIYSASTTATNIATGTYATLTIKGSATKSLVGNTTATTAVTINTGGTLGLAGYTFTATDATWTNLGTVSHSTTGSKVVLAGAGILSDSAGAVASVTSFGNADLYPTVHIQITDSSLNFDVLTAENAPTAVVTSTSGITDVETVILTETTVSSGIFQGSITFALSGSNVTGRLDYQGGGTVSYTWTDSQNTDDTETASASFVGTTPGGGSSSSSSSSSGGAAAVTTTTTVTPAPTTVATTVTPAAPAATTPTVSTASTLESVQTKVAAVIAKIAALPATPTASDLTSIQAEIAAILIELQSIQAAQPVPQGIALGFNFVRPLALGLRHADVSNLQKALKTDLSVYPEGLTTGYFGPATLRAVQRFQEKYGIASSGQPGYGNVGPATRAKLNELFGGQ